MSLDRETPTREALALDVLDCLLEGCQVIGFDWKYLYLNDAVAKQARQPKEALLGRTMMECFPGIENTEMFGLLRQSMADRAPRQMENEFTFPDGSKGWFELRIEPVPQGVCILSLEITERKRSEADLARSQAQLRHAQKMEAVGRLAGGVAHDFNNLLTVIASYSELVSGALSREDPLRADVEEIRRAARRATELTRQLLAFSRHQIQSPRVFSLNQALSDIERLLQRLLGADIDLNMLPGADLWNIRADAGQVEQVLMNLAVNARDAMPNGGKLTFETSNVHLDVEYARAHHGVAPGRYVMLAVTDSGIGMDHETQARIFEPFYTTKEKGKGTGLGLSMVFGIVKQSGGHIWVYSEPGIGTTFKVYFPMVAEATDSSPSRQPAPLEPRRGTGTVLLVEDDEQVRGLALGVLRRHGYVVLEAPNAGEALLICEQYAGTIHLLLTDVVLPRMNGRQLAERLANIRPGMKVLFMSGYTDDTVLLHGVLESGVEYLEKPLTPTSLIRKVSSVLSMAR